MPASSREPRFLRRIVKFEAHHRVGVASVVAALTFATFYQRIGLAVNLIVSWDAFALCSLALAWAGMFYTDAKTRVEEARLQDSSRMVILCCLVLAAVAGLFGAGLLLSTARKE